MNKNYHHGDLKAAAVTKAVEIIRKKGEVDFTLREIAKSLKVSHTAVYRHFSSKQELLSHIAEEGFVTFTEKMNRDVQKSRTLRQKLRNAGRSYIQFALDNPGHYRSMFHQELRCFKEQRAELLHVSYEAFATLLNIVTEGIKEQIFKKEDPLMVSRFIWASIHGFSVLLLDGQFQSLQEDSAIAEGIEIHLSYIERAVLK